MNLTLTCLQPRHTKDPSSLPPASAHLRAHSPPEPFISTSPLLIHLFSPEQESKNEGVASGDQTERACALCVHTSSPVCEEQLKSNSSEQVFAFNDLSLLSISLLTTSCRGRSRQGQTQPRQTKDQEGRGL